MSAALFDHRRQQYTRSFCCGAVCPWSWRDWASVYLASFLCGATLFAPRRDAYLQKVSGRRQHGKAWKCRVSTPACPRCAAVDRSRYRAIFFDQKRMRSTKDRKKGCAYDPGALMIQGALQNQTLRYVTVRLRNPCERSWAMGGAGRGSNSVWAPSRDYTFSLQFCQRLKSGADMAAPGDFFLEVWTKMFLRTRSRYRHGNK